MWALPNIHQLNEEASRLAALNANKTEKELCEGQKCGCGKPAVEAHPIYDPFSDDPKEYVFLCKRHAGEGLGEGYFYCDRCGRDFVENYTWETYFVDDPETSERLCLNCALDKEMEIDENWITSPEQITLERVRQTKHLIPVKGEHWKKYLNCIGNVTLDSATGAKVTGYDSTSSVEDTLDTLKKLVAKALAIKTTMHVLKAIPPGTNVIQADSFPTSRCILILDGTFQFAVSIGVYIENWEYEKPVVYKLNAIVTDDEKREDEKGSGKEGIA